MNSMRFFALGDNDDNRNAPNLTEYALQPEPGVYNETIFKTIDFILASADFYDLKVIVTLIDNWKLIDGAPQYQAWCTGVNATMQSSDYNNIDTTPFWSNAQCRQLYKNHVKVMQNRVNTVNGRVYKNDPTIMAWDLYNEPRCQSPCSGEVQPWIEMMAPYFKTLNSNHMLTVGEEGFFGPSSQFDQYNPVFDQGATWPQQTGQDFVTNHALPQIDFAAIHLWPNQWNETDASFANTWLTGHINATQGLAKPLLLEEFGKYQPRDPFYQAVYDEVIQAAQSSSILQGAMFWLFQSYSSGANDTARGTIDRVPYGIIPSDSTWGIISSSGATLAAIPPTKVQGCVVGGPPLQPQSLNGPGAVAG